MVEDGRDIREEFFAEDGNLYHYHQIVTPGRHGNFVSKVTPVTYDKDAAVIRASAEMNPCAWYLTFEYREDAGWLLVHYGYPAKAVKELTRQVSDCEIYFGDSDVLILTQPSVHRKQRGSKSLNLAAMR